MSYRDIILPFGPLPNDGVKRFHWNSSEWWSWFKSFRRKPSAVAVLKRLREYDEIVSFHAARPLDPASYYATGIELGDVERMNARAREIFLSAGYPSITPPIVDKAIADASTIHDKTLFAVLDEREVSGHYLIYGSEHICGIAASMSRDVPMDCRQILKNFGTPTLFRISVPLDLIPEIQIQQLAEYLLRMVWDERRSKLAPRIDWSLILKNSIPATCMVDHVHPERIPDPLQYYFPYSYKDNFPCII
jgi:hypothetical protein